MERVSKEYFEKFGYEKFGPFLKAFSEWLLACLKEDHITKVYFLSRDGYILKQAFDVINDANIKTYYMYASRRAVTVPALYKITSIDDVFNLITFPLSFTISTFCKKTGIDESGASLFEKRKLDVTKEYNYKEFIEMLDENELIDVLISNIRKEANNEKNIYDKYVNVIDFKGKVAIVDIGWYGSMQKALSSMYSSVDITGYYIGIDPYNSDSKKMHGFLFDKTHDVNRCKKIYSFRGLFEFLTLARHGSVKQIDSNFKPVLYEYEYSGSSGEKISEIVHTNAIQYILDKYSYYFEFKKFVKPFLHPTICDAINWGNIKFLDTECGYMAKPKTILYYLKNIKEFKRDFKKAGWKIGYMKRLLIIPFPYYTINMILRKKFAKR